MKNSFEMYFLMVVIGWWYRARPVCRTRCGTGGTSSRASASSNVTAWPRSVRCCRSRWPDRAGPASLARRRPACGCASLPSGRVRPAPAGPTTCWPSSTCAASSPDRCPMKVSPIRLLAVLIFLFFLLFRILELAVWKCLANGSRFFFYMMNMLLFTSSSWITLD